MDTKKILASKTTEKRLLLGIALLFVLSLILSSATSDRRAADELQATQKVTSAISDYEIQTISVNTIEYSVLVSDTDLKRVAGLSDITSLPNGIDGMLFIFPEPGQYGIWMKDMIMSLDIFWLDENFEIVYQELNVSPDTFPTSFKNEIPAKYVLEIPTKE